MLIKIDETVMEDIKEQLQSMDEESLEIKVLDNLATAVREGYHIIIASLEVLEFLKKLTLLENKSKRIYEQLFLRYAFLGAYEDFCNEYILIKSKNYSFNKTKHLGKCIYETPINFFEALITVFPTALVSEDLNDCIFYESLTRKYIVENKHKINVNLSLDYHHGGGQGSHKIFENKINDGRLTLAIADSDKSHPDDKIGNTLSELITVYGRYENDRIIDLYGLKVREKENLVPPSFYLLCANSGGREAVKKLLKVERAVEQQPKLKYMDVKDGLKVKDLKKDIVYRDYYEDLFKEVTDLIACSCEEINNKEDEFQLIQGIGGKLECFLEDVLGDGLERKLEQKRQIQGIPQDAIKIIEENIKKKNNLFSDLPEYVKNEWEVICTKIISWGCSEHHISV
ncbi:hypothetical protein G9298_30175 (plasmid) [Bacillus thuringiensis]|nr:hypothetical protein G9298_30175 [Bacillus thuringiensis]